MDMLSRNEVFEEDNQPLVKAPSIGAGFSAYWKAATSNFAIIRDVLAMIAIVVVAWFVWRQALPYLWPAGPALLIAPGFGLFMAVNVVARVIWNILFLVPKVR